jgi:arylsulfatase A-like enzyme
MRIKIFTFLLLLLSINAKAQRTTVLIIADDLSADYFGFFPGYGDTVDVPNIRYLANKGIVFTNHMSNPVCSSTRTTILTGRYSFRTGVGGIVGGLVVGIVGGLVGEIVGGLVVGIVGGLVSKIFGG